MVMARTDPENKAFQVGVGNQHFAGTLGAFYAIQKGIDSPWARPKLHLFFVFLLFLCFSASLLF
jgi:hypothetical protein